MSLLTTSTITSLYANRGRPLLSGTVIGALNQRKGTIVDTETRDDEFTLTAEVALNDMFGYSSQLRGMTQGKGEFSMEYKVSICMMLRLLFFR